MWPCGMGAWGFIEQKGELWGWKIPSGVSSPVVSDTTGGGGGGVLMYTDGLMRKFPDLDNPQVLSVKSTFLPWVSQST